MPFSIHLRMKPLSNGLISSELLNEFAAADWRLWYGG
jgi:hypothetical protein